MLLRSKLFYCLRLPIYSMLERGEPNPMLGVIKARRVSAASQQTLFIVSALRLPIHPMLKGGNPKAMLWVMKVLMIMLLRSKLFLLSPAPHPI